MNDGDMDAYKYLRVLEGDEIKHTMMKRRIEKEYLCCLQKILKSKLKGGNMLQAINCRVVAVVGYAAGMVERTNLQIIDRKTHKLMTLHHPCICRLISTGFTLKDQWVVEDLPYVE